jgi:hypothetical protein
MAFDITNTLETSECNNGDIDWYDGDGSGPRQNLVSHSGTTGGFWYVNNGSTPSGSTGASSNPPGNDSFVYAEMSGSPAGYEFVGVWTTQYSNLTQALYVEIDHWLYCLSGAQLTIEYSTLASPDPTDNGDWTVIATATADGSDPGQWDTLQADLSGIAQSSTVSIRIRYLPPSNNYANDGCIGNWRIYSIDTTTYEISGVTYDKNGDILGSCHVHLCKDNGDDTATWLDHTVSNSSTGAYTFTGAYGGDANLFIIAWKDDSPHVMDCTDHVLQATEV